jgi:DNA-binding transcriptional regulator YiaG
MVSPSLAAENRRNKRKTEGGHGHSRGSLPQLCPVPFSFLIVYGKGVAIMTRSKKPRPATRKRKTAFGTFLTARRMELELTQMAVATVLDVHPGRISEWEQGKYEIPDEIKDQWIDLLK